MIQTIAQRLYRNNFKYIYYLNELRQKGAILFMCQ